ncbi:MAG: RHS repeat-associated core domain-containing protein [Thermoguttaceae bacterium]|jgi:RHS repeat-associated protein
MTGRIGNTLLYTGQEQDPETGLYYCRARWYNPSTGDFMSRDQAQSDANLYRYVDDDPISLQDPSGLAVGGGGPWTAPGQPAAPQQPGGPPAGPCGTSGPDPGAGASTGLSLLVNWPSPSSQTVGGLVGQANSGDTGGTYSYQPGSGWNSVRQRYEQDFYARYGYPVPFAMLHSRALQGYSNLPAVRHTVLVTQVGGKYYTYQGNGDPSGETSRHVPPVPTDTPPKWWGKDFIPIYADPATDVMDLLPHRLNDRLMELSTNLCQPPYDFRGPNSNTWLHQLLKHAKLRAGANPLAMGWDSGADAYGGNLSEYDQWGKKKEGEALRRAIREQIIDSILNRTPLP